MLYSFKGDRYGIEPYGPLIADGNGGFYGTTSGYYSKTKACGSVFQLSPPTGKYKTWFLRQLHVFARGAGDGCNPLGGLVADSIGRLYGTTAGGGATGGGTVFGLFPSGAGSWTEDQLYSFGAGSSPMGSLIRDAKGVLYGTTSGGGATGNGSVFAATPAGAETTLYSFQGGADGKRPTDALVEDKTGAFYGTTYNGGGGTICQGGQGCGTVFKLTPPVAGQKTWTETLLWLFTGGEDGSNPYAGVSLDKSGNLYGVTVYGGSAGAGVAFELSPPAAGQTAWVESVLHNFQSNQDGGAPYGNLIFGPRGVLYGTTFGGGSGGGTVFKLSPPSGGQSDWTESQLFNFAGGSSGEFPYGGLLRIKGGDLFGTTSAGGANNFGTVFEVTP